MPKTTKKVSPAQTAASATPAGPRPRLHKLKVSNFRCIGSDPVEIELDDIVVLVGPNNAGKSSILRAYEVVMQHGSTAGELARDDFPNGVVDQTRLPTIELETVVFDKTAPGEKWVRADPKTNEMFVREKWTWNEPGKPKKVGWDVAADGWHASEGPWGAPNVAQYYRPQPHRVSAFEEPAEQAKKVAELLKEAINEKVKQLSKKKAAESADGGTNEYKKLLEQIKALRVAIADDATAAVKDVRDDLTKMINEVFPGYAITFDARPEDDIEKTLSIYKTDPLLKMGPADGFQSTLDRQGSGACRTLIWTALRILSERVNEKSSDPSDRPHLLLIDEPEICLHPDAIREACRVLYDLPKTKNWQVMITTHSPVFIDLSRDNTSIVRVERAENGVVKGTTIFRPQRAKLDEDDQAELKLLNLCDPYLAEFFFGGKTILVEGDTECTAFKHIIAQDRAKYRDIHILQARGKGSLVALCKILNQFDKGYAVLHDADRPEVTEKKTGKKVPNSAWLANQKILEVTASERTAGRVRLLACVPDFDQTFFGETVSNDKPYSALARMKADEPTFLKIAELLDCLIDSAKSVPVGVKMWTTLDELKEAVNAFDDSAPATSAPSGT